MARSYIHTLCPLCDAEVSSNGFARMHHNRGHVREGLMEETRTEALVARGFFGALRRVTHLHFDYTPEGRHRADELFEERRRKREEEQE